MIQRLAVRDNETPERARKRFDGQLGVRDWGTPRNPYTQPEPIDPTAPKTPWWWDNAESATQPFMDLARAKGMI